MDWTEVGAIATGAGSCVSAVVGGLIGWQAWETRRTADAGRAEVEVSGKTLAISQAMAVDAAKTRLDARAPKIRIAPRSTANEAVNGSSQYGQDQPWPVDRTFRRTEDDYVDLVLGASILVANEGDRSAIIQVNGDAFFIHPDDSKVERQGGCASVALSPGEDCEFRIREKRSVAGWAEVWEAWKNGESKTVATVEVICSDQYDEGVIDNWIIGLSAWPIEPVVNDLAGWRVRDNSAYPPVVNAYVEPQIRTYFISKKAKRRLEI